MGWFANIAQKMGRLPQGFDTSGMTADAIRKLEIRRGVGTALDAFSRGYFGNNDKPESRLRELNQLARQDLPPPLLYTPSEGITYRPVKMRSLDRRKILADLLDA